MARSPIRQSMVEARQRAGRAAGGGILRTFVRHPNAANMLMALMIIFGLFSLARINTQFFPPVEQPSISVSLAWPGSSAEDVERNVLALVEPAVRYIDGVDDMSSTASEGSGSIRLDFAEGTDMQRALAEVESAVRGVSNLPTDVETPRVTRAQFFEGVAKLAVTGSASEDVKRNWAKRIRDDLVARGIDRIEFTGLRSPEIVVDIDERELRRLGMTIEEVSQAISANSRDVPSGNVEGSVERQVRLIAERETPARLASMEIKTLPTGERVTLGDVARIDGGYDPDEQRGFSDGTPAIELDIQRAANADTLQTASILNTYLASLTPQLPANVEIQTYDVASDALEERVWLLIENGIGGLLVVIVVLFLFLDFRIALWVAAGIPVAVMATIGLMYVSGQSINMISIFALIMMLGIIVDDAIVVGEQTNTRLEMGDDPLTAAENGVGMVMTPVIAAMATTLAAFAPIVILGGPIGQMMSALPLVVIAVLVASLVECFFVLPGHLAHSLGRKRRVGWSYWRHLAIALMLTLAAAVFLSRQSGLTEESASFLGRTSLALASLAPAFQAAIIGAVALLIAGLLEFAIQKLQRRDAGSTGSQKSRFREGFDRRFEAFRDGPFDRVVSVAFHWRYVTVALSVGVMMIVSVGLLRGQHVPFVFFESPEAETISGSIVFNAGLPEDEAVAAIGRIENALREAERDLAGEGALIAATFTTLGTSGRSGDTTARINVQLTTSETRTIRTPEIVAAWEEAAPDIAGVRRFSIFQARLGPPGRDVEIRLQGDRIGSLKAASDDVIALLATIPGVSGVEDDLPYGKPELVMELTTRGALLGFTTDEVGRQIRNAFQGAIPFRFARGDDEVTVRISQTMRQQGSGAIRNFELRTADGSYVPLTEVVSLSERQGFSSIRRRDGQSTLSVTGDVDLAQTTPDAVLAQVRGGGGLDLIAAEHGVEFNFGGRAEEQEEAFSDLTIATMAALTVIYIILAWVFGSYWRPIAVMLIIPFGLAGAIFGHWLMGFPLTIMSLIGLLGLGGILVNDSIILVDRLDERLKAGDPVDDAAIGASRDRFRAVLLTSLTTIGGLGPLIFETSIQAQFLIPMAVTIVFGLGISTVLVLMLVPAFIGIGYDIRNALSAIYGRRAAVSPASL
ncbi:efflux RND transporter permease subunit [Rhizobium sp. EC-SD404]|uniref:efflux RND transporter permease subunit n=1 Tax=Rhizobium sp. EC-SD404 TaxID=2038389 RepID=UPI0012594F89|nr:efflux RND transporter permease subunit [Rhizobium sp. EC-SD404]VVT32795.1 Cation/multidrug efflux pump [Rhizobium sp. EC-SD404]